MKLRDLTRGGKRLIFERINKFRGWSTERKIIVIESDDWGAVRMPNKDVRDRFIREGYQIGRCNYMSYDSLASPADLDSLFWVLRRYRDKNGEHPKITANTVVANPNFAKIKDSNFTEYFYEPFTDTLKEYGYSSYDLWVEGIEGKLFVPQFHGREHVNVRRWLRYLRAGSRDLTFAFDNRMYGVSKSVAKDNIQTVLAAFDQDDGNNLDYLKEIIDDGLTVFEKIFKYKSESFIPPNYILPNSLEDVLKDKGVKYLQGTTILKDGRGGSRNVYLGKQNSSNQIYLTRNCVFEPSSRYNYNWVDACLKDVNNAFKAKKPAIICSHRVNYIGSIVEENRNHGLGQLDLLLKTITENWPEVEFMTSSELGQLISKSH